MIPTHPNAGGPYTSGDASYRPDRYYRYAELTALLEQWAADYPTLAMLSSIGRSYEERDIWCVTLTNAKTGPAQEKPAYFIDANVHAGEVAGSAVALYTIQHLLTGYGTDGQATRLLDDFAIYVVPRVSVDGAELYLTTAGLPRSSVRLYPAVEQLEGLVQQDLDQDGWITTMRVPDADGPWKVSPIDPRLMIRRPPDEVGGHYFWLLPEGMLANYDRAEDGLLGEISVAAKPWGLDLNRNFPIGWESEAHTKGAGPYPMSEPESRALGEFLINHPNIVGSQHYHTFAGVILRPSSRRLDEDLPKNDLAHFKALGAIGEAETGYPCISLLHDFTEDPRKHYAGMLIDWAYDHLGLLSFSTELWSLGKHIGIARADKPLEFYFGPHRFEDDDLAMLRWVDEHLDGFGFVDWHPFVHPQLGPVEIGGWQTKYVFQNPPGPVLEEVCRRNCAFTLRAAGASPRLHISNAEIIELAKGVYRVEAILSNAGYLPTQGTERAVTEQVVKPDTIELTGEEVTVVSGPRLQKLGHIPGRSCHDAPPEIFPVYGIPTRRKARWIIQAIAGTQIELIARSTRGGVARYSLTL